ncbi:MAG: hypothetical protein ACK5OX_01135 [Desertimonas sp.]
MTAPAGHVFASPGWLEALRTIYLQTVAGADLDGVEYSMCEVFHDVPLDVHPDTTVAWHVRISNGTVQWSLGEIDDAMFKIVGSWAAVEPLARATPLSDPAVAAELQDRLAARIADGSVRVEGSQAARPPATVGVHDAIAAHTVARPTPH